MDWGALGKPRTKLGRWLDSRGITQQWLARSSKLSKGTISRLTTDRDYIPSGSTMKKVIGALRRVDPNVSASQLWDL